MPKKIVGLFCEEKLAPLKSFDRKSLRWKKSGKTWLLIGCPIGKYSKLGRCRVGTRAYVILRPAKKNQRCQRGMKRIRKG